MAEKRGWTFKEIILTVSTIVMLCLVVYLYPINSRVEKNEKKIEAKVDKEKYHKDMEEIKSLFQEIKESIDEQKERDHQKELKDAEWKGSVNEVLHKSMYYGKFEQLDKLNKSTEENQRMIEKKIVD